MTFQQKLILLSMREHCPIHHLLLVGMRMFHWGFQQTQRYLRELSWCAVYQGKIVRQDARGYFWLETEEMEIPLGILSGMGQTFPPTWNRLGLNNIQELRGVMSQIASRRQHDQV